MRKLFLIIVGFIIIIFYTPAYSSEKITIGIIKYRGGDWYDSKNGVTNFLSQLKNRLKIPVITEPPIIDLTNNNIFNYPIVLINGHGQILLDDNEKDTLKKYLDNGGFLLVNDDYGIDKYFRELVHELYPEEKLKKLPNSHKLFNIYYSFPNGLPKIHRHDDEPAAAYGLYHKKRLIILYMYSSDIVDGWEKEEVHKDPVELREKAIKFGINIIWYVLTN